jgi:hypothetical protein
LPTSRETTWPRLFAHQIRRQVQKFDGRVHFERECAACATIASRGLIPIFWRRFAVGCGAMSDAQFTDSLAGIFWHMAFNSVDGAIHQICMDWRHMSEFLTAGHQGHARPGVSRVRA